MIISNADKLNFIFKTGNPETGFGLQTLSPHSGIDLTQSGQNIEIDREYTTIKSGRVTSNQTTTLNSMVNVTNMAFAIGASEAWVFKMFLNTGCSASGGIQFQFTAPSGYSKLGLIFVGMDDNAATQIGESLVAASTETVQNFNAANRADGVVEIYGCIVNGANSGNVQLQYRSNTSGQTSTIYANSHYVAHKG